MNLTINCDASFSNKHNIGTYAFWIVSDLGRITGAGPLRKKCRDSNDAEMKCILNAIATVCNDPVLMMKVKIIHVNTDSMNSISVFTRDKQKLNRYGLKKYDHLYHKYLIMRRELAGKEIHFAHVKAHVDTSTKRSYVNDWLDKAAKEQMGILLSKIKT